MYTKYIKRLFDISFSLLVLVIFFPLLLIIGIIIKINDGGKIFFYQQRIGKNKKSFNIIKFRSMYTSTEDIPSHLASSLKITGIGKIIRRTNIDEIPQFINVIKGEMSVIGPRPSLLNQTELIALRQEKNIFSILPGLTGLAQINAYDNMPFEEKVKWDEKYIHNMSFVTDFKIFIKTFIYFLKKPPTY